MNKTAPIPEDPRSEIQIQIKNKYDPADFGWLLTAVAECLKLHYLNTLTK